MNSDSDTAEAVGFPIRKSTDQSLFAAPRSLSQRTTSFIACVRQGIHQMPLGHLIALIVNAHPLRDEIDAELLVISCINACPWIACCDRLARANAQVARSAAAHQKQTPTLRPDFIEIGPSSESGLNFADHNWRPSSTRTYVLAAMRKPQVNPLFTM